MTTVININATSGHECRCGSWLSHWQNFSGQRVLVCSEINCTDAATDGAHVQVRSGLLGDNNKWYIVPFCRTHNLSKVPLVIRDNIALVSANRQETCEPKQGIISRALGL